MATKGKRHNLSLLKVQQQTAEATCFSRRLCWDFYKPAAAAFTFTTLCKVLLVFERANLSCHPHAIVIHAFRCLCMKKKKKIKQMSVRGWQGCKRSDTGNRNNTHKSIELESERIKLPANPKCGAEVLSHF